MAPLLTIDVDDRAVLAALNSMPATVLVYTKPASKVTADNIAREWRNRFARSKTAGLPSHGGMHAYTGVKVAESRDGQGYIVFFEFPDMPNLAMWLEYGTVHMLPHPIGGSMMPSIRLEEGPHMRRMFEAVQSAIDVKGLGD